MIRYMDELVKLYEQKCAAGNKYMAAQLALLDAEMAKASLSDQVILELEVRKSRHDSIAAKASYDELADIEMWARLPLDLRGVTKA